MRKTIPTYLGLFALAASILVAAPPPPAVAQGDQPSVTIESPGEGEVVAGEVITVTGSHVRTSELELVVDAQEILPVKADGESGNWSAQLDLRERDGTVRLAVRGRNLDTRYTQWSQFVSIVVDNPDAAAPTVAIISPHDGAMMNGSVTATLEVGSRHPLTQVEARLNGGSWQPATKTAGPAGTYRVPLAKGRATTGFASIEARAVDVQGRHAESSTVYIARRNAIAQAPMRYDQDRAIWVWERAAYEAVFDGTARARLAQVLKDTDTFASDPITTIYLGVDDYQGVDMLRDARDDVAGFVVWARENGFRVQATVAGGTNPPYLGALPEFEADAVAEFEKVLNYNLAVEAEARFDGINVDIEPYILPQWKQADSGLQVRWLELLQKLIQRRDASGQPVLVGPAIPRWLDSSTCCQQVEWQGQSKPLSDHIQDLTDYIAIMDYRDTADGSAGIIAQAAHEIEYGNAIGKPDSVIVGVETKDLSGGGDPETVTFWEEGRDHLESELDKVYASFGAEPSFGGIAMHHYDSLLALPSVWGDGAVFYPSAPGPLP